MSTDEAKVWFVQAGSDYRTAKALHGSPGEMRTEDVGCHVAAMCAQVVEKSIKGYVIVNGATPALDHRPDKYLSMLLVRSNPLLRHRDHYRYLSKLFDSGTKNAIRTLLDLSPGGRGRRTDLPNTEYPWTVEDVWVEAPAGSTQFGDDRLQVWLKLAKRVFDVLHKLTIAADRGPHA